jgi:hypothetical protein
MTTHVPNQETADRRHPAASRRRRHWIVITVLITTAVLTVVLVWFQPQVLLYNTVVEDDLPTATPAAESDEATDVTTGDGAGQDAPEEAVAGEDVATNEPAAEGDVGKDAATPGSDLAPIDEPVALLSGTFESRNRYTVTGGATAYDLPDGTRIVRLEGFESTNGPDLFVYLTVGDASEPSDAALAAEHVDLGLLRGNVGNQNYDIPADVDLERFNTVVIWCRRFGTAFGAADLG